MTRPLDPELGQQLRESRACPLFESGLSTTALPSAQCETGAVLQSAHGIPAPEIARARKTDGEHSKAAARSITNIGPVRQGIYDILCDFGPRTDEEIKALYRVREVTKLYPKASDESLRTRRSELVTFGYVVEAGTGKTVSGRNCSKWAAKGK